MKEIKSQILPLPYADINTDLILPAKYLTTTVTQGLGEHLFSELRKMDPSFPMNLKKYRAAQIIVARRNFGCGSSREHAAWSLVDHGIRVIVAPNFGDIFYSNAVKNHLLPLVPSPETIEHIFAKERESSEYIVRMIDYAAAFLTGAIGSLAGHPADTALTRWQNGMRVENFRQLMWGSFRKARAIGGFSVLYKLVMETMTSLFPPSRK